MFLGATPSAAPPGHLDVETRCPLFGYTDKPFPAPTLSPVQRAVFLPWLGEFGVGIRSWLPFVHHYPAAHKIVCCRRGEGCKV